MERFLKGFEWKTCSGRKLVIDESKAPAKFGFRARSYAVTEVEKKHFFVITVNISEAFFEIARSLQAIEKSFNILLGDEPEDQNKKCSPWAFHQVWHEFACSKLLIELEEGLEENTHLYVTPESLRNDLDRERKVDTVIISKQQKMKIEAFLDEFDCVDKEADMDSGKFVFIAMPFSDALSDVYNLVIEPVCTSAGLIPIRVDKEHFSDDTVSRVFKDIMVSRFIIADLSGHNPNVCYELGYARALEKNFVVICQDRNSIPFDFRLLPHIFYSLSELTSLKQKLAEKITGIIKSDAFSLIERTINDKSDCRN